jgi:hypothetical protein
MNRKNILLTVVGVLGAGVALLVMTADPPSPLGARPRGFMSVTYTLPADTPGVNFKVSSPLPASNAAATNAPAK